MADGAQRFAAFISYSHTDEEVARWLHRRLEGYRIPKAFEGREGPSGPIGARIGKVFRDREEFAAGGELKAEIEAALDRSDALIVLCSPASAASQYVNAEVRYFKERGGARIIPVILSGDYPACVPAALQDGRDRLSADFRESGDGREAGSLKIISGLLGVGLDDLVQRDAVARRWRMRAAIGVVSLLAVLGVLSSIFGTLAYQNVMRARDIHAQRLTEETNFLIDEAIAARERGDSTAAVERALQALPIDFDNPERPFSLRAIAALQGALFDATMVARADATEAPVVGMRLIDSIGRAYAATADGQLLEYDVADFRTPRAIGRCAGTPQQLAVLDSARAIAVGTDEAVCAWRFSEEGLRALPVLERSGTVAVQSDRIVVSGGETLSAFYFANGTWTTIDTSSVPTPAPARTFGAGLLAFDHGNHFHLIDAFTRQNVHIGCLGDENCPSSVASYQAASVNADRTRIALYRQGEPYFDFVVAGPCTTDGPQYYGDCEGGTRRVPIEGQNTVGIAFASGGAFSTYVRDEFAEGYDVGNADSGGIYYTTRAPVSSDRALSRNGRFLAVFQPGEVSEAGGDIVEIHDLLAPESFTGLAVGGRVKDVDLGDSGRRALVLERDGRLTLHNALGRTLADERRWSTNAGEAPYTYFTAPEAVGVVFPGRVVVMNADALDQERVVNLNGGRFNSAQFRDKDNGCVLSSGELICITGGQERRFRRAGANGALGAYSDDMSAVAVFGEGRLALLATNGGGQRWSVAAPDDNYCCVHFSASGETVLISYRDGTWAGYDAASGRRRYQLGAAGGPYSRSAINAERTAFLARVGQEEYAIFDIDTGERMRAFNVPLPNGEEFGAEAQEIAIDGAFSQLWYVARLGEGVIRDLDTGQERRIDIDDQILAAANAEFSPSGAFVVRESAHMYSGGAMAMPESMQIVDLARGVAAARQTGTWSPIVGNGTLDTNAIFARTYNLGLETLITPPMAGGTNEMRVQVGNGRVHASLALIGLSEARPFGRQSVEFSLDMYALAMTRSQRRLVMTAMDNASAEFVVRTYRVTRDCAALRAEGEALLGRRPSPPSSDAERAVRLGWLERAFSALLGRQRFSAGQCASV